VNEAERWPGSPPAADAEISYAPTASPPPAAVSADTGALSPLRTVSAEVGVGVNEEVGMGGEVGVSVGVDARAGARAERERGLVLLQRQVSRC
jgi:hypothetical protein